MISLFSPLSVFGTCEKLVEFSEEILAYFASEWQKVGKCEAHLAHDSSPLFWSSEFQAKSWLRTKL